ncbi:bifunctional molybdopterin-guanine dinucleotide biosynthesis protein MoaC/MobA [Gloeomargarita lithophora Alchichica-D10]|uniref:Probable molybdenum cofactor guanylyltransferase n=1 Tax=Gloeomargarita lithophora Alchichica-D10 TaxID=1188229 RepID=A0A1J0ADS4_9CYAN|nr:cyclic pyranopterin monophosphate synthase MoaC [Gloeomargarita lithophora]APB34084.1 bifunctional molybdopterin-guanine dinucleotide biosynthesis protein MoaC/MobA [Gloeomargarita lithophora Alchichica-D10]
MNLSHLDANNQPKMVDISSKSSTLRRATAQAKIQLPSCLQTYVKGDEILLKKGAVFQTAIIAGTMAVKKTEELIPFCHQIPIESCTFAIEINSDLLVTIQCTVKTTAKTGVEMEALCGVTIAALTIYDMCKSLSPHIVIRDTQLLIKTGGKTTLLERPLYGLILTGGHSKRMGQDKALLNYHGQPYAIDLYKLMQSYCQQVYLSARPNQWLETPLASLPTLPDHVSSVGPISGLLTAFQTYPNVNWLVIACDLMQVKASTIEYLLTHYEGMTIATCYTNLEQGFPEPLCAIYTPKAHRIFTEAYQAGIYCPVKILKPQPCTLINPQNVCELMNINTPEDYASIDH